MRAGQDLQTGLDQLFVVVTFLLRCAAREDNLNRSAIGGASDTVTLFLSQIWIKQFVTVF